MMSRSDVCDKTLWAAPQPLGSFFFGYRALSKALTILVNGQGFGVVKSNRIIPFQGLPRLYELYGDLFFRMLFHGLVNTVMISRFDSL